MQVPLYAIAAVGIGAAGVLSYGKIAEHKEAIADTQAVEKETVIVQNSVDAKQKLYAPTKEVRGKLVADLSVMNAETETKTLELEGLKRTAKSLDAKLATQKETIAANEEEVESVISELAKSFGGEEIAVEEIPGYISKLEAEREDLTKNQEEVAVAVEEARSALSSTAAQLQEQKDREASRVKTLKQSGVSSLITAVNNNWGFVIIKPHPEAVITADSKLIIVRGSRHLGRLNINAVEPNRVVADIDYDSLTSGLRVRAGDRVILAKTSGH